MGFNSGFKGLRVNVLMLETLLNGFIDLPFTFFHCSAGHCLITLTGLFDNRTAGEVRRLGRLTAPKQSDVLLLH